MEMPLSDGPYSLFLSGMGGNLSARMRRDQVQAVLQSGIDPNHPMLKNPAVMIMRDIMWRYNQGEKRWLTGLSICTHPIQTAAMMYETSEVRATMSGNDAFVCGLGHDGPEDYRKKYHEARVRLFINQFREYLDDPQLVMNVLALSTDPLRLMVKGKTYEEKLELFKARNELQLRRAFREKSGNRFFLLRHDKVSTWGTDLWFLRDNPTVPCVKKQTPEEYNYYIEKNNLRADNIEKLPIPDHYIQSAIVMWDELKKIALDQRDRLSQNEATPRDATKGLKKVTPPVEKLGKILDLGPSCPLWAPSARGKLCVAGL